MAFDGLFTTAMVKELQRLATGRISKIHQPNNAEVVLHIRAQNQNFKLLISTHSSYARMQLTQDTIVNPAEPPMFCMVLRKHLENGVIRAIRQVKTDRIIAIDIRAKNEIGDDEYRTLIVELMGRHSNLILINEEKQLIIDSMKHLPPSVNSYRTIMPGQPYVPAPEQNKLNPYTLSKEDFLQLYPTFEQPSSIVKQLAGFSPMHAKELLYRLKRNDSDLAFETYQAFLSPFQTDDYHPTIAEHHGKQLFSALQLSHAEKTIAHFRTLSEMLDVFYYGKAERERVKAQAADLERWLDQEIKKLQSKLTKLMKEQQDAEQLDTFQLYGELLTAYLYSLKKGDTVAVVNNYYADDEKVTIPLDPQKTPVENAQRYYAKYAKAKNARIKIAEQIKKTNEDIEYLEMVRQQVIQASTEDIEEIREELGELGYLKAKRKKKKQQSKKPMPETYRSSSGLTISVGKNNKQNDYVTFQLAARDHIWLHTKDIPGSHVVIHDANPDEQTLQEAAILAAYFSKARGSSAVPVDYTAIRHVKKPNGAKPGFVIYFEQKTLFVTPDEAIVRNLKK